jgi:hypothetical protein
VLFIQINAVKRAGSDSVGPLFIHGGGIILKRAYVCQFAEKGCSISLPLNKFSK